MRGKILNAFYIIALSLDLLSVAVPVLPHFVQICAIGLFLVYLFVGGIKTNRNYQIWTFSYVSFFLLSSLWAIKYKLALWVVLANVFPIIIMSLATITYIKRNQSANMIFFIIYINAIIMLSYLATHIDEFILGVRLGSSLNEDGEEPIWNSNQVGVILCFALFSGFICFINQKKSTIIRIIFIVTALAMIAAIFLTGSRKALLIILFPVFVFLYKKKKKYLFFGLFLLPIIGYVLYQLIMNVEIFYESIGVRVEEMVSILSGDTTGTEDDSRMLLIEFGLNKFIDNPIIGVGINNFRVLSEQIFPGKNWYAHNNYVELLVDVGIIGLVIYYSAYFYLFKRLNKSSDSLSIWGIVFLYTLLFLGLVEVLYYDTFEQLIFCVLFCIVDLNNKTRYLDGKEFKKC